MEEFALSLGLSPAEILMLSREAAGEDVRSLYDLREEDLHSLIDVLLRIELVTA